MSEFILALAAVFISAGALLIVANQLGLPPVPFYILAGIIAGAFIDQPALIELSLWGVAFLVFVFGTQVDLADIQSVLRDGEIAAVTQLIVVAPIAFGVGYVLGITVGFEDPIRNALYFAAAATLSSTLVGAKILQEEIRNNLVHGRLASSIHFFDDIVAIGALLVLSAEVLTDDVLITSKIGYGVLFLLAGLLIYRHGYPLLVRVAGGVDELVLMGSISLLIVFLAAAEYVGISIVVGAFAAGLSVRTDDVASIGVKNGIESIKDFFAAIFFVTVGALVTFPTFEVLGFAGILIILVVVVNPIIHTTAFILEGYDGRTGFLAGSSLNQISELAIVIAIQAWLLETIAPALFEAIILAAAVTMIFSALAGRYEQRVYDVALHPILGRRRGYLDERSHVKEGISDHVVIIGYGRQGHRLVRSLEDNEIPYVVIENDPAIRDDLEAECANYVFGDAMARYPLELTGIERARLVVSTVDHLPVSRSLLELGLSTDIILRADSSPAAQELFDEGATFVVVPNILAIEQLLHQLERVLGDESEIEQIEAEHRKYLKLIEFAGLERRLERI